MLPPPCNKKIAFTLAEVLIALVVIGIIAAITLTAVMPNIQERVNSQRQANIVYKVTQATNLMKANGAMINGFESTDAFVDELQKYLKIMKRCDSDHIADCWPTKKVRTSDGDEYDVENAKTRILLGFKENGDNKNVGLVLADGATIILTYDPSNQGLSIGDKVISLNKELPVGGKYKDFLEYTTNTTASLAFVMDVNGSKGPNKETFNNKLFDIRSFNGAHFQGCAGKRFDNKCYTPMDSYPSVNCKHTILYNYENATLLEPTSAPYCGGEGNSGINEFDGWAGAQKTCMEQGMQLPTYAELQDLCQKQEQLGISFGDFYSSDLSGPVNACRVQFHKNQNGKKCSRGCYTREYFPDSDIRVLCVK